MDFHKEINSLFERILFLELAYRELAFRLKRKSNAINIPVLVLTATMGTAAFNTLNENADQTWIKIMIGILGIVSAILVAWQTQFKYAERAAKNKVSAEGFSLLKDELEAIRIQQDEQKLAEFCEKIYPSRKESLIKDTDHISRNIKSRIKEIVDEKIEIRLADIAHKDVWDPFVERDQVYRDVADITQKLEDKNKGEDDFAFKLRKELNFIHLNRKPPMLVAEVKEMFEHLRLYTRASGEQEFFDNTINTNFIEAVFKFQRINGLEHIDGIVGPYTKKMLKEAIKNLE